MSGHFASKEDRLLQRIRERGLTLYSVGPGAAVRVIGLGVDVTACSLGWLNYIDLEPYFPDPGAKRWFRT